MSPPILSGPVSSRTVCLFALYTPETELSSSVLHYLTSLAGCGFSIHVALSGMTELAPKDRETFDTFGIAAYPRPNQGLDFGAWQYLMRLGCTRGAEQILLANDSVFGPVADLAPIVASMQAGAYDVWGMVESHEMAWHLQSWFICLTAQALARPAIARIFDLPFERMSKGEIVLHGEIGLGVAIRAERLSWAACLPDAKRGLRRLVGVNPMHVDWISALRCGMVPFVKIELLRDNPARIPWLGLWRKMLRRYGKFPESWIEERIAPVTGARAGCSLRMRLLYVALTRDHMAALRALLFAPR